MSRRKRFDRQKKTKLRQLLAERDHLVPEGAFHKYCDPYVRCSVCQSLVAFSEITIGHILPLSEGGIHALPNLRLECDPCNQEENNHVQMDKAVNGENATRDTAGGHRRLLEASERRSRNRDGRLYDSVVVLDVRGRHASYTSFKQARGITSNGKVKLVEAYPSGDPKVVQLDVEIPLVNPDEIHRQNLCLVCESPRYLRNFSFWPHWHPEWSGARKTHRTAPLCRHCVIHATRWLETIVRTHGGSERHHFRKPKVARSIRMLLHAYGRMKKRLLLPEELLREIREVAGVDLEEQIAVQGIDATMAQISEYVDELKQNEISRRKAWRTAYRKRILHAKVDFHELFWEHVRDRREELAPFLNGDESLVPWLEIHLKRVRQELEARGGMWTRSRKWKKYPDHNSRATNAADGM